MLALQIGLGRAVAYHAGSPDEPNFSNGAAPDGTNLVEIAKGFFSGSLVPSWTKGLDHFPYSHANYLRLQYSRSHPNMCEQRAVSGVPELHWRQI